MNDVSDLGVQYQLTVPRICPCTIYAIIATPATSATSHLQGLLIATSATPAVSRLHQKLPDGAAAAAAAAMGRGVAANGGLRTGVRSAAASPSLATAAGAAPSRRASPAENISGRGTSAIQPQRDGLDWTSAVGPTDSPSSEGVRSVASRSPSFGRRASSGASALAQPQQPLPAGSIKGPAASLRDQGRAASLEGRSRVEAGGPAGIIMDSLDIMLQTSGADHNP